MREPGSSTRRPRVLIAFATTYGQTAKIARAIAETLTGHAIEVDLREIDPEGAAWKLTSYDGLVVGASVIRQGLQPPVRRFLAAHVEELAGRPSAFFQVSGAAGSELAKEREAARRIMNGFLDQVGWAPTERASFGGAINYTQYPLLLKWIMKWISWRNGGSTDTSRDHEYTEWDDVRSFADRFAAQLGSAETALARVALSSEPEGRGVGQLSR